MCRSAPPPDRRHPLEQFQVAGRRSCLNGLRGLVLSACLPAAWLAAPRLAHALDELRSVMHPRLGKVSLLVPVEWTLQEKLDAETAILHLHVSLPVAGVFELDVAVAETVALRSEALNRRDLDTHVRQMLADALPQSLEGAITPQRFGLRRDESLYARLTDKDPAGSEYRLVTRGVRLQGRRAMVFTLFSNDANGALLKRVLDLVSSFAFEPLP